MTLQEARNEINVREEEIAKIDLQIEALQNKIAERQEDWDFERKQREQDPNWRIAALDYIQKGDRSGLESYTTNRLMAEQSLVDRINSFDIEKANLIRDERQVMNAISLVDEKLKNVELTDAERAELESKKSDLQSQLDAINTMKKHSDLKKQSAQEFYERRYGKSGLQRKLATPVEQSAEEPKVAEPVSESDAKKDLNYYRGLVSQYARENKTNYNLTIEDVNQKYQELATEMASNGMSETDIANILAKLPEPKLTRLDRFKNIVNWDANFNKEFRDNGDPSEAAKKSFLAKLLKTAGAQEAYDNLSDADRYWITTQISNPESAESKAVAAEQQRRLGQKIAARDAAANDERTKMMNWKNNSKGYIRSIDTAIAKVENTATYGDAGYKEGEDIYNKLSDYDYKQLQQLGYSYDAQTRKWTKSGKKVSMLDDDNGEVLVQSKHAYNYPPLIFKRELLPQSLQQKEDKLSLGNPFIINGLM